MMPPYSTFQLKRWPSPSMMCYVFYPWSHIDELHQQTTIGCFWVGHIGCITPMLLVGHTSRLLWHICWEELGACTHMLLTVHQWSRLLQRVRLRSSCTNLSLWPIVIRDPVREQADGKLYDTSHGKYFFCVYLIVSLLILNEAKNWFYNL